MSGRLRGDPEDTLLGPVLAASTAFAAVVESPRAAIVRRAGATESIETELRRLQSLFKDELDKQPTRCARSMT